MITPSDHPAAAYPTWLKPALVPVTVVCGPPGNGWREWLLEHAAEDDLVLEMGTIIADLAGVPQHRAGSDWIVPALLRRNALLGALAAKTATDACWLVVGAPAAWQRQFWATALGATVVVLDPGIEAALIGARETNVPERYVHQWYAEAAAPAISPGARNAGPRPTTSKRGYGSDHQSMRDRQLEREPHCRFCFEERGVRVRATVLDHIKPFRSGGVFDAKLWGDPKNQRSLCGPCHDARGATRSRAEKAPGAGLDGRPLDPNHPWSKP